MAGGERGKGGEDQPVRQFLRQSLTSFLDYHLGAWGSLKMIFKKCSLWNEIWRWVKKARQGREETFTYILQGFF